MENQKIFYLWNFACHDLQAPPPKIHWSYSELMNLSDFPHQSPNSPSQIIMSWSASLSKYTGVTYSPLNVLEMAFKTDKWKGDQPLARTENCLSS